MHKFILSAIAGFFALAVTPAMAGPVLDAVKARGQLVCGVSAGLVGFMHADSQGVWRGLSVDMCRATAAALLGDAGKVKYIPLEPAKRIPRLNPARSISSLPIRPSPWAVTPASILSASTTMTVRASWCRASSASAS
jgi:general L-amino acid transport system substrate-binding protein